MRPLIQVERRPDRGAAHPSMTRLEIGVDLASKTSLRCVRAAASRTSMPFDGRVPRRSARSNTGSCPPRVLSAIGNPHTVGLRAAPPAWSRCGWTSINNAVIGAFAGTVLPARCFSADGYGGCRRRISGSAISGSNNGVVVSMPSATNCSSARLAGIRHSLRVTYMRGRFRSVLSSSGGTVYARVTRRNTP